MRECAVLTDPIFLSTLCLLPQVSVLLVTVIRYRNQERNLSHLTKKHEMGRDCPSRVLPQRLTAGLGLTLVVRERH